MFAYELSGCGFESSCSHLELIYFYLIQFNGSKPRIQLMNSVYYSQQKTNEKKKIKQSKTKKTKNNHVKKPPQLFWVFEVVFSMVTVASFIVIVYAQDISVEFEVSCYSYSSAPAVTSINYSNLVE